MADIQLDRCKKLGSKDSKKTGPIPSKESGLSIYRHFEAD